MRLAGLDPRVKLLMLLGLSTLCVWERRCVPLLYVLGLTLLILLLGGVSPGAALKRLRGMLGLVGGLFLLQCLFNRGGGPLLVLHGVTLVTRGGLDAAALVSLRLVILLLSALIVLTGESRDYLLALTQARVPYELAFMVLAALRFIPLLREEAGDVLCAVQMRGTRLKGTSPAHKAGVYVSVMLPVVAGALRRAEELSMAMEARAFRSAPRRTSMRRLVMGGRDWLCLALFVLALGPALLL